MSTQFVNRCVNSLKICTYNNVIERQRGSFNDVNVTQISAPKIPAVAFDKSENSIPEEREEYYNITEAFIQLATTVGQKRANILYCLAPYYTIRTKNNILRLFIT